jgi:high-affinity iron transporter
LLSNFLIALREGLEAALIVGILLAYVVKTGRSNGLRFIWIGVASAISLSLGIGAVLTFTAKSLPNSFEPLFAGGTAVGAVALVTWMVFWMRRTAHQLQANLHQRLASAMGPVAIATAAFLAVVREGIETSLFLYTNAKTAGTNSGPLIGLLLGFALAIALGWAVYNRAIHLDLGKFFLITGVGLIIVAAGVLAHGIGDLEQSFNKRPALAFDVHHIIGADSVVGRLLSGTIGFSPVTTVIQASTWALYLVVVLSLYLRKPVKASSGRTVLADHEK